MFGTVFDKMSRTVSAGSVKTRPSPLSTKSFTRYEPSSSSPSASSVRSRASTIASPSVPRRSHDDERQDVFNKVADTEDQASPSLDTPSSLPDRFDELPIELASLTDRYRHCSTYRPNKIG